MAVRSKHIDVSRTYFRPPLTITSVLCRLRCGMLSCRCQVFLFYHPNFVPRHLKLHVWQQCRRHLVTPHQLVPKGHSFFFTVLIDDCVFVTKLIRNLGDQTHLSPTFHDIIHRKLPASSHLEKKLQFCN